MDDIEDNREIVRARLEANQYEVAIAVDGEDALQKVAELTPDLILLDVMMPKLDGIETVKRLKSDPTLPFIPVILLTAKSDVRDVVQGLQAGADDYLTKPIEHSALVARVGAMLRIKALQDKVRDQADQLALQAQELDRWNRELEQRVAEQIESIDRMGRLKRFLPPQIAEELIRSDSADRALGSHRADITVLFCDLRGFTSFSEVSEPEDLMAFLRDYHAALGERIFAHGGTLERFTGDSVMVFFNDPTPCEDHCARAVALALDMRNSAQAVMANWNKRGLNLGAGIGVAAGYATLGRVGFDKRFDYAAIGTVTNLASRLCGIAEAGQILVSGRVAAEVETKFRTNARGEVMLKGFSKATLLFEVTAAAE